MCVGVWTDDFEVAVFLTETSTRHSVLRKEKRAGSERGRIGTTDGRLTGSRDAPVEVGESAPGLRREESDEGENVLLAETPAAGEKATKDESREGLFVSDESGDEDARTVRGSGGKRKRSQAADGDCEEGEDDKKKLALNTTYDGFSIYGRILCLVVKRRGTAKGKESAGGSGQAMMEEWIASTQMGEGQMMDE